MGQKTEIFGSFFVEWPWVPLVPSKVTGSWLEYYICSFGNIVHWLPAGPLPAFSDFTFTGAAACREKFPILSAQERTWPSVGGYPILVSRRKENTEVKSMKPIGEAFRASRAQDLS